jgi:predicted nuclease of predicted toxin-antitoxin system
VKIHFQANESLSYALVQALLRLEPSIEFTTAQQSGVLGLGDPEVLAVAARSGRLLVTRDKATFPTHFADFITQNESSGVIVIPPHLTIAQIAEELFLIWLAMEAEEWTNRIIYLPM